MSGITNHSQMSTHNFVFPLGFIPSFGAVVTPERPDLPTKKDQEPRDKRGHATDDSRADHAHHIPSARPNKGRLVIEPITT